MTRHARSAFLSTILILLPLLAQAEWRKIQDGVHYQEFRERNSHVHVVRVDLREDSIKVIASGADDRGLRVKKFAEKHDAIVAVNADYFSATFEPVGLAIGPCGQWTETKDTRREGVVGIGEEKVEIWEPAHVMRTPPEWVDTAVSGWPMLVRDCKALTSSQLPGSNGFTRTPHPRTALGLSRNKKTMYLVVADGRREEVPGLTLAQLAAFMREELGVCRAINLDGGGSSELVVEGETMNRPSDGTGRKVANHIAIVSSDYEASCDSAPAKTSRK